MGISLLFVDQAFEMFLDNLQDYFSYYLCDDWEHVDIPSIVAVKMGVLFWTEDYLLLLTGKDSDY